MDELKGLLTESEGLVDRQRPNGLSSSESLLKLPTTARKPVEFQQKPIWHHEGTA
ncbi:MAG: hypothetical protein ACAF41_03805 [Leptolyngbya sp. BL-A-14]